MRKTTFAIGLSRSAAPSYLPHRGEVNSLWTRGAAMASRTGPRCGETGEEAKQVHTPTRKSAGATDWNEKLTRWLRRSSALSSRALSTTMLLVGTMGIVFSHGSAAQALPYTLAGPVAITGTEAGNPGVIGTLLPVAVPSSLSGVVSLDDGDTTFVTNDVIVFAVELLSGSLSVDQIGIGAAASPFIPNPVGAGVFAEGGTEAPDSVNVDSFVFVKATFDFVGNTLAAGETTKNLFATFSPAGSALGVGTAVNISISSGVNFTVQTALVPEPGTALLLGGGLAMLGLRQRRKA